MDFTKKRNALFACLDNASKELTGTALDQNKQSFKRKKVPRRKPGAKEPTAPPTVTMETYDFSKLRGKESIFKKPEIPIEKCLRPRSVPDYEVNPHKWKKYTLSDVDISDKTNTAAAFAFLKEIDERRDADDLLGGDANNKNQQIEFKKSIKLQRALKARETDEVEDAEIDKPKLKGTKLVMPEYVIGQKKKSTKRETKVANTERAVGSGSLILSHLQDEDET